jgi:hypothetical protein
MTVTYRKAIASEAKPLIGLYAESGRGKTYGALLIARGFVADMSEVIMIETEAGRGEAHASDPVLGGYNVIPLRKDFSPKVYGEAISVAEDAGAKVLIIDSASHEWEGVGGVLAMAEALRPTAGAKGMWRAPKLEHSREFMLRMTQTPIPVVICNMRAKYPMFEVTKADLDAWERAGKPGKTPKVGDWARSWQLEPKQSDDILSEMFVHGWIDEQHRFHMTKDTMPAMRQVFIDGEPLTIETGKRLAAWAAGRTVASSGATTTTTVTVAQQMQLQTECNAAGVTLAQLLERAKVDSIDKIPAGRFDAALAWVKKQAPAPAIDEAAVLRQIESAADQDAAAEILDRHRDAPFYARASDAFKNRWSNASA